MEKWIACETESAEWEVVEISHDGTEYHVALVFPHCNGTTAESNAERIAMLPELVEALRELWRFGVNSEAVSIEEYHDALDRTSALLAKIDGE